MFKYIVIDNNTYQQINCYTLCQILIMSDNHGHTNKSTQTLTKYKNSHTNEKKPTRTKSHTDRLADKHRQFLI